MSNAQNKMADRQAGEKRPVSATRQLAAASVGNAVEWYDWFSCTDAQAVHLSGSYLRRRR
ncbi:hypothetical protein AB0I82_02905 [Streptomyces sp. NPDC050315]|uniref:hypothetical protein n=1 Tax=Streptomyces sp. NPDC050315 TaxID=3155039 RepID=UPI003414AE32